MSNEIKDPLDEAYEAWLKVFLVNKPARTIEALRMHFPHLEKDIKEAFRQGWLHCEDWYSENDDKEIIIGVAIIAPPNPEDIN